MKEPLSSYLKRIYFDNLVYTPAAMRSLLDQVGSSQVVLGTDYPFDMGSYNVRELVSQIPSLTGNEHDAILSGNALRLFGIDPLFFHRDRAE
jgi:aminocarboxymuconate-semialdehyde decarboxylase